MTLHIIAIYAAVVCLIIGAIFTLVGAIGLLKFNSAMTRLHAPTKVGTIGVGALLLASMLYSYALGQGSMHELLIMAFLFVTAPISANFISKVNIHRGVTDPLPEPPVDDQWSTLDVPPEDREIALSKDI